MIGQSETPIKPEVRTLGLDMAARCSGVCMLRTFSDPLYDDIFRTFLIRPKSSGADRLVEIEEYLNGAVDDFKPDLVAIEGYSYDSENKLAILAEVGGITRFVLRRAHVPFEVLPPKQLKLFTSGNGAASKAQMVAAVQKHYGVQTDQDDIADAIGLAKFAALLVTGESVRRCELEVVRRFLEEKPKAKRYKRSTPHM